MYNVWNWFLAFTSWFKVEIVNLRGTNFTISWDCDLFFSNSAAHNRIFTVIHSVPKKMVISVFLLDKKLKIPIYSNFDARSPNSGSKTMPDHYFTQNSRKYSIADFPIFEDLCGFKKQWFQWTYRVCFEKRPKYVKIWKMEKMKCALILLCTYSVLSSYDKKGPWHPS